MTASDDPALSAKAYQGEFIGESNKAFAKLNFLNATILLSTEAPGLDVYQWKRSKRCSTTSTPSCGQRGHQATACLSIITMRCCSRVNTRCGTFGSWRKSAVCRQKRLVKIGIPYMDEMAARLEAQGLAPHERTVLLAPSWGQSAIFSKYGGRIIEVLLKTRYHIVIRPHPQSFTAERS